MNMPQSGLRMIDAGRLELRRYPQGGEGLGPLGVLQTGAFAQPGPVPLSLVRGSMIVTNILPTFYQHFTQPWPIQTAAAKLRGGSSPHYTQAAAWCATHHRVARTSCLPANTAGLFFEPYPVRSPCSPWLHLTMMPCERYICVQAFLKLFSTRYIHSTSLYFGILERLPFDMFWHVLKCVDMFWLGMQRIAMSLFHAQLSRPGSWK